MLCLQVSVAWSPYPSSGQAQAVGAEPTPQRLIASPSHVSMAHAPGRGPEPQVGHALGLPSTPRPNFHHNTWRKRGCQGTGCAECGLLPGAASSVLFRSVSPKWLGQQWQLHSLVTPCPGGGRRLADLPTEGTMSRLLPALCVQRNLSTLCWSMLQPSPENTVRSPAASTPALRPSRFSPQAWIGW